MSICTPLFRAGAKNARSPYKSRGFPVNQLRVYITIKYTNNMIVVLILKVSRSIVIFNCLIILILLQPVHEVLNLLYFQLQSASKLDNTVYSKSCFFLDDIF